MDPKFLLFAQLSAAVLVYLVFFRKTDLPFVIKLFTVVSYVTVHLFTAIGTAESSVYLIDFALPIFVCFVLMRKARLNRAPYTVIAFLFLIFFPAVSLVILKLSGAYSITAEDGIYFIRSLNFLGAFSIGLSLPLTSSQVRSFIWMNICFAFYLGIWGLLNYAGPYKMDTFLYMRSGFEWPEWYLKLGGLGYGFLGLFKGEVGQWFASVSIIALGAYGFIQKRFRKFVIITFLMISLAVILLSNSRTALIGTVSGMLLLILFRNYRKFFAIVTILATLSVIVIITKPDIIQKSLYISQAADDIEQGTFESRVEAWEKSAKYFGREPFYLISGIGPATYNNLPRLIGLYGSHNEYLEILFKGGIFALMSMLGFYLIIIFKRLPLNKLGKDEVLIRQILIALLFANAIMAITQSHLVYGYATYRVQFYLWFLYGVLISSTRIRIKKYGDNLANSVGNNVVA